MSSAGGALARARRALRSARRSGRSARARPRRARAARARLGRAVALRPLAGRAHRSARSRLLRRDATGSAPALLGARRPRRRSIPAVLLPLALAWTWRRRGRREALVCCGDLRRRRRAASSCRSSCSRRTGCAGASARQLTRPLQIESLGSALLLAAHQAFGLAITMKGEPRLAEPRRDAAGRARGVPDRAPGRRARRASGSRSRAARPTRERLVRYSAAAVCAFVALGKVLSPQFLIWLVPLVAARRRAARPRRRGAARRRAGADAALVPVPLLGPRAPLRRRRVVARPRARPRPASALLVRC